MPGRHGLGQIIVERANGKQDTYNARYRLELVSFDMLDENQDGIYEPGERIIIQRIRIKNTGSLNRPVFINTWQLN
jgi:hypothetical protein